MPPHNFNDTSSHMLPKQRHRMTSWTEYNLALRRRGELTIWFEDGVAHLGSAPRRKARGGQARYSDLAIELCLTLPLVFGLPLRQTQGFVRSIAWLTDRRVSYGTHGDLPLGLNIGIARKPDSTFRKDAVIVR